MWKNKIVKYEEVAVSELTAHPQNWRTHSKRQEGSLESILGDVGIVQNIIVNINNHHVIDGHLRLHLANQHHQSHVPVTYVDLTEEEERVILATFDVVGSLATTNYDVLKSLTESIESQNQAIDDLLSTLIPKAAPFPEFAPITYDNQVENQPADKSKNLLGDALSKTYKPEASERVEEPPYKESTKRQPWEIDDATPEPLSIGKRKMPAYSPRDGEIWIIDHAHRVVVNNQLLNERDERLWLDSEFRPFKNAKNPEKILAVYQQTIAETKIDSVRYWNIAQCGTTTAIWYQIALRSDQAATFISICDEQKIFTELL